MATQLSKQQGSSNHAEPPADVQVPNEKKYDVHVTVGSAPSQSRGALEISKMEVDGPCNPPSLQAAFRGDWESAKRFFEQDPASNITLTLHFPTEKKDDVKDETVGSSPQSRGAPVEVNELYYRPLLQAAFRGDWEFAKRFFNQDSASKTTKITRRSETVLHIAALSAQDQFVEKLVELLTPYPYVLEMVDWDGRTALHIAVLCGRIRMVKVLVRSNHNLTKIEDNKGRVPLGISALEASMHKEIAWFLAENTTDNEPAIDTIIDLVYAGHLDIALYLVRRYPHLIIKKKGGDDKEDDKESEDDKKDDKKSEDDNERYSILDALASRESNFPSGTRLNVMEKLIYKCIPVDLNYRPTVPIVKRIHEVKLRHMAAVELAKQVCNAISDWESTEITEFILEQDVLGEATIRGISEIVKILIQFFPELILVSPDDDSDDDRLTTSAVKYRQERTLRLFLKVSSTNKLSLVPGPTEKESKKMMDAAAEYAAAEYYPSFDAVTNVAGAAFQMQRELQWYKAVESWSIPGMASNYYDKKTYWNKFVDNHKDLLESGEKWMKDTANSCMLVSTLIATVLFAAAFTVPGGNNNNTGVPLLLGHESFLVFAISDALGLFSSVTAILLFLAILTSRYEAQDFLESLPRKIIMGLSFLFLSLAFMLVAFAATLSIVLDKRPKWLLIPIILLTIPAFLFLVLQLPLLHQMVKSTYGTSIFRPESNSE
ncbi:uncharacterized protein LOC104429382 isoform X2 [Eucalyptus grandis]|uniref:uncharacterized protein LOC104429382 isoform X2 n=1 Tax=Eucalyptus grandis TaxID=71139 RepID=UPI0008A0DBB0|nr:uncharacterized protein LOC104429382 isoform X2 [Eucalyptus grandis]